MIPVIVINLERSADRKIFMQSQLDAISVPHEFFVAVDGREMTQELRETLAPPHSSLYHRPLTAGEIGCAQSHLSIIRKIVERGDAFTCVLEDDAVVAQDIRNFLQPQTLRQLPAFDVLRLIQSGPDRWKRLTWQPAKIHGHCVCAMPRPTVQTKAQIFSIAGARKIAAQLKIFRAPIDMALFRDGHVQGLRVLELRPGVVSGPLTIPSIISTRDKDESLPRLRIKTEICRLRGVVGGVSSFVRAWGLAGIVGLRRNWTLN